MEVKKKKPETGGGRGYNTSGEVTSHLSARIKSYSSIILHGPRGTYRFVYKLISMYSGTEEGSRKLPEPNASIFKRTSCNTKKNSFVCRFGVEKEENVEISCPEKKGRGRALRPEQARETLAAVLGHLFATLPKENYNKD